MILVEEQHIDIKNIITLPDYNIGKRFNDYGKGFYCTQEFDLACEWAVEKDHDGYANCYDLDIKDLSMLDLDTDEYGLLDWLAILLTYRDVDIQFPIQAEARKYILDNFYVDVEAYDIVKGYRADDSYFSFARAFLSNSISYRQLGEAMHLGDLGQQIVLKSKEAYSRMESKGYVIAPASHWYSKKKQRDLLARQAFNDMLSQMRVKGDIFVYNIIDEEMKRHDLRLR